MNIDETDKKILRLLPEKTITYKGYHELAYLHPNVFTADKNVVRKYFNPDEKYFILRFAKLKAHHDSGVQGIDTKTASQLIEMMSAHGKVYITRWCIPFKSSFKSSFKCYSVREKYGHYDLIIRSSFLEKFW